MGGSSQALNITTKHFAAPLTSPTPDIDALFGSVAETYWAGASMTSTFQNVL